MREIRNIAGLAMIHGSLGFRTHLKFSDHVRCDRYSAGDYFRGLRNLVWRIIWNRFTARSSLRRTTGCHQIPERKRSGVEKARPCLDGPFIFSTALIP